MTDELEEKLEGLEEKLDSQLRQLSDRGLFHLANAVTQEVNRRLGKRLEDYHGKP